MSELYQSSVCVSNRDRQRSRRSAHKVQWQSGLRFCFALYGAYDKSARGTCRQNSLPLERKESVAYDPNSKPYALEVAKKLKEEMITRRGLHADVEYVDGEYQYRLVYHNDTNEKVSIIIPSKDNFDILKHF